MKKVLSVLITLIAVLSLCFAFTACNGNNDGGNTSPKSEKGNTYKQSEFVIKWESEEAKATQLDEMFMTEEQFMTFYNGLKMTLTFENDRASVIATGYGESGYSRINLYYTIAEDGEIKFYETAEAQEADTPIADDGFFMNTFTISSDYRTVRFSSPLPGTTECAIVMTIAK